MNVGATLRMVRHLRPAQVAWRVAARARRPWHASALYARLRLAPRPAALATPIPWLWPGDAMHGRRLVAGRICLAGEEHPFRPSFDWKASGRSDLARFHLHEFRWLADLAAAASEGETAACALARAAVGEWIDRHQRPSWPAWHPYPLSLRLHAWLAHAEFLSMGAGNDFRCRLAASLDRQARHLGRVLEHDVGGNHLIKNLKALVAVGRGLTGHETRGRAALAELAREVARQVLADGCHYERSPSYHLQVLMDLIDVAATLGAETPGWLADAIRAMGRALAFFRLGDEGLALFNDGEVGDPALVAAVAARLGGLPEPPAALDGAGYFRLAAGGTVAIMDAGRCCPDDLPAHAHADTLAFELAVGRRRVVVNGGTYAYQDAAWRNRLRGTAAHSTATIDGGDSAEVFGVFRLGRRPGDAAGRHGEEGRILWAEGHHDGYRRLGVVHRRRLELARDGHRLDGRDCFELTGDAGAHRVAVRFHLHPDVETTAASGGAGAAGAFRLVVPGEGTWRFEAPGEAVRLEGSHYAPRFGDMRPTRQIVIEKPLDGIASAVAWRLVREEGG